MELILLCDIAFIFNLKELTLLCYLLIALRNNFMNILTV